MVGPAGELSESAQEDENMGVLGLGCSLDMFAEVEEVVSLINNLHNVYNAELSVVEHAYERYVFILDQYHEQPHLLDPHLDRLLKILVTIVLDPENPMKLINEAFKYMYVIINVRGYKVILRHLPHEIADFDIVLQCLECQNPAETATWTTRYSLLLWLSILVKMPFELSRLDDVQSEAPTTVVSRMYEMLQTYIVVAGKCRDAAAYLAGQFLTRVDVKDIYLSSFFNWAIDIVNDEGSSTFAKQGALATVAMILKHGKREDLYPYADKLLRWIINTNYKETDGANIPKLGFKIVQRIGLTFLPPKLAPWRYQRGNRVLVTNLSAGDTQREEEPDLFSLIDNVIAIPIQIEEIIDQLLQGLRSPNGVVRWSAAKGIGRVTGRLPKQLADDIVGSLLELCTPRESDAAWHGACLTLAELGRRGLLLPQRLPDVVPVVVKALMYDELRGYTSVGAHIRDAACYVSWAFARAYDVEDLQPYVADLARALLIVAVFDREVNCRRAASAAFQENVGRQGTFPHGIEILTEADFFSVGSRTNTFLNLSVFVAQFKEYTNALIDHLIEKKVDHWDSAIRELTAKALHNLTEKAPDYMTTVVLDILFLKTTSIDLNARHGAVLAIGEIIHALYKIAMKDYYTMDGFVKHTTLDQVRDLIPEFRQRSYFRGLGGELMKQACCSFIQKCSLAQLPFHDSPLIDVWVSLLNECISYEVASVRAAAIETLPAFFIEYYQSPLQEYQRNNVLLKYLEQVKKNNQVLRMGYCLAIGSLPAFMLQDHLDEVINTIIGSTRVTEQSLKWAESRRDALKALTRICETVTVDVDIEQSNLMLIYDTYLNGLLEYTQDNRGDVGAWVREAAMIGIQSLTILLAKTNPQMLIPDLVCKLMATIAQQAVEKIDRTRALAGRVFFSLIHNDPLVPYIPDHSQLQIIFPASDCDDINWNSEVVTFPKFVRLLALDNYTYNVLVGLIISIGGLTETLVKTSSAALFAYLNTLKDDKNYKEIARFCIVILDICIKFRRVDRVMVPVFRFLEKLMSSGCIQTIIDDKVSDFMPELVKLIQEEINSSRDIYKLVDGIAVFCQFIQVPTTVCNTALVQLSIFLCHRQTYVRKATSTRLYEALLVHGESSTIPAENLDNIMTIICDTNWENPVEELRPIRNNLCELMGIRPPVPKLKKN